MPTIVKLGLLTVLAALLASASAVSAQSSAPVTPDRPTGTVVFIGGVDLEWNDVAGADSYDVQLYRNGQWIDLPGDGVEIAFYGAGAIIRELDPTSSLWFQVRARNAHGISDWSDFHFMASTNQYESGRQARPDNVAASGAPAISGTPLVGETLSADTTGIVDANGLDRVEFRFQWVSNDGSADTDITGATDSTYTLVADDAGKPIKVRVSFTDRGGYAETLTSDATVAVTVLANSPATGAPVITGTTQVGETLTADTSGIADDDGLSSATFSYQWVSNDGTADRDITGATDSSYVLVAADEGTSIKVRVSFTDDAANDESLTSDATEAVAARHNSPATGAPAITGTAQVGQTLASDTAGIADTDGLSGATFSYQWVSNDGTTDTDITGATDSTYTLVAADEDKTIKVRVSFTDDVDNEETLTSTATSSVAARPNSPATGSPTITGTAQVGETLTADTSGIADADGLTSVSHYEWIFDRTGLTWIIASPWSTYTLVAADEGTTVKVRVSFTDDAGHLETLTSTATEEVSFAVQQQRANSAATGGPVVSGTAQVGETLTAHTAGIADADGLTNVSYSYQWISNDGTSDADISGATGYSYTLVADDEGNAIKVKVTFTDDADNNETLTSATTGPVIAAAGGASGQSDSEGVSYITVEATEDTSDPNSIVTNFTVDWSDADDCSTNYNTYLNVKPHTQPGQETSGSQHHLGSAASDATEITKALTGVQGYVEGFDVEVYCGTDTSGRKLSKVDIPSSYGRPKTGTYSSESPLSALSVSDGTLTPAFRSYTSSYTVPDVANDVTRTTITATPEDGYAVEFYEWSGTPSMGLVVYSPGPWGPPSGLSEDCDPGYRDTLGPQPELTDADSNTAGFQVDLYDGVNYVMLRVYPTAICDIGENYFLTITRAEGSVSLTRPNSLPVGGPGIRGLLRSSLAGGNSRGPSGHPWVGVSLDAIVDGIIDRDGSDTATFSYQWLADDAEITGATGSSYTVTNSDLGKTLKVRVDFTDDRGTEESVTSEATRAVKLANIVPTGKPVILGSLEVGQTLIADVSSISDPNGMTNATLSYEWVNFYGPVRDMDEYTLVDGDGGRSGMWLWVTYTDDAGHEQRVTSESIGVVAPRPNSPATGTPAITGMAQVGETLTADTSGIADADGLANVSYSYKWVANDGITETEITGATGSTYVLAATDESKTIKVQVSFTDDAGNDETLTSTATEAVSFAVQQQVASNPATGGPTVIGTVQAGETLTADTSAISDADGLVNATFVYQWISSNGTMDNDIEDETSSTYIIKPWDLGKYIKVRVSFTDDAGYEEALTGAATTAVEASPNEVPTGAPIISGMAEVGQSLSLFIEALSLGIWDGNGMTYATLSYQWIRSDGTTDSEIPDASDPSYTLTDADAGMIIKIRVSFTDDGANAEALTSSSTTAVAVRPDSSGLDAPTDLWVDWSQGEEKGLELEWTAPEATVTGYQILRKEEPFTLRYWEPLRYGCTPLMEVHVNNTGNDATTYTDTDVLEGAAYTYSVRAINSEGVGSRSSFSEYTIDWPIVLLESPGIPSIPQQTPSDQPFMTGLQYKPSGYWPSGVPGTPYWPPSNLSSTQIDGDIVLTWEAPEGEITGYQILRRMPEQCEPGLRVYAEIADSAVTSWTDNDVEANTLYEYHIRAVNDVGAGRLGGRNFTSIRPRREGGGVVFLPVEPNSPAQGVPIITGTAQVGETLTADGFVIADQDGLESAQFDYQWLSNDGTDDTEIAGATSHAYTLTPDDEGKTIKLRVSFTDDAGYAESLTSTATASVAARPNSEATGAPTISGTAQVEETLTADTSGITDADGLANVSYSYQWVSNDGTSDTEIPSATDSTYTLVASDEGNTIKVEVSFTDDAGFEETLTSTATASVVSASEGASGQGSTQNSPATGAPTISGTAQVGETLTADTSGIADSDGLASVSYSYQWIRNDGTSDSDITDATGSSYTLVDADEGNTTKVKVTFTDDADNDETLTSTATSSVAARPNSEAAGAPTISGTAQVGETLTADTSGITDSDGLTSVSYSYQWISNDGTSDTEITGATDSTYTLVAADEGKTIKVRVSFTDDADNDEGLISTATDEVAAAPLPLTVSLANNPASHNGTDVFTFQIRFSEETRLSFRTLRDQAFTVTGGTVKKAKRQVKGSNMGWTITVEPDSNAAVEIVLPTTTDCATTGAICTGEGRKLSNRLEFRVSGPNQ